MSKSYDFAVKYERELKLAFIMGPEMEITNNGFTHRVLLPSQDFTIAYSMLEFRNLDFSYPELNRPDLEITQKISDMRGGIDTQFEAAVRFLSTRTRTKK